MSNTAKKFNTRLREIDFLRGIAVILVLFAHHWLTNITANMGWIGVDLFFVLSGFLVSSLLFTEYKKFGNINPKLFLIRRGFKIYPLFYFSIIITLILLIFFPTISFFPAAKPLILNGKGIIAGLIAELLFLQSYIFGFWGHHWSLSVEEHFYILLIIFLYFYIKKGDLLNQKRFLQVSVFIFVLCFIMRIVSNLVDPLSITNFTATHLRIDSLFAGVLISYFYNFNYGAFSIFYKKYKKLMLVIIIPCLSFTPFFNVTTSFFIKTIGFTLVFISFGCLLTIFLFEENIEEKLKKFFGVHIVNLVAKIGFYSYSIYLFHFYIVRYLVGDPSYAVNEYMNSDGSYLFVIISFVFYFTGSIVLGIIVSYIIETPMLKIRDRYFPRRTV